MKEVAGYNFGLVLSWRDSEEEETACVEEDVAQEIHVASSALHRQRGELEGETDREQRQGSINPNQMEEMFD